MSSARPAGTGESPTSTGERPTGTGELVLSTLYLAPTPGRETRLCDAASALGDWSTALAALEAHGILGLALRNLERAGATPPSAALQHLRERAAVMRALDLGFRLTLERFAAEAWRAGVEVTLLKGAALALDLYPARGLRAQGDLDLLVSAHAVSAALAAARRIGLRQPKDAFPPWWYRLAHFHLKLVPDDALQRELELHWDLHPPAQLYTVHLADLCARRTRLELAGTPVWVLDPLDRLLHLVTHLARHARVQALERESLRKIASQPLHALRLKWLVDIHSEIELRHAEFAVRDSCARAQEWSAEGELAWVLAGLSASLCFSEPAGAWVAEVLANLPRPAWKRSGSEAAHAERPLAGFDLRASSLRTFPRWVWPPGAYFHGNERGAPARVRLAHAGRVLCRTALAGIALPAACIARAKGSAGGPGPLGPAERLELAAAARQLARREEPGG